MPALTETRIMDILSRVDSLMLDKPRADVDFFGHAAVVLGGQLDTSVARNQFRRRMPASGCSLRHASRSAKCKMAHQSEVRVDRKRRPSCCADNLAQRRGLAELAVYTNTTVAAPQPGTPPSYPAHSNVTRVDAQLCARDLQRGAKMRQALPTVGLETESNRVESIGRLEHPIDAGVKSGGISNETQGTCADSKPCHPCVPGPCGRWDECSTNCTLVENLAARYPESGRQRIIMALHLEGGHAGRAAARLRLERSPPGRD